MGESGENGGRLPWATHRGDDEGMAPRLIRSAVVPAGRYEVFMHPGSEGAVSAYDCWFTRAADGMLITIGTAYRLDAAMSVCESDAGRGISPTARSTAARR